MKKNITIISVGGSIIIPPGGFDIAFLKKFRRLILSGVRAGRRFVLVVGGGATCRAYQQAAARVSPLTDRDLDWIGIHATRFNAQLVKYLFKGFVNDDIIINPTKPVRMTKPIVIGAGYEPGHSTDMDAVLLAKKYGAKNVINLSNIEHVYTKDPRRHADARKIERIDWKTFRKEVVGGAWKPGKNVPFDPVASREAERLGLTVSMVNGTNLAEVKKAIEGKRFTGTVIHP